MLLQGIKACNNLDMHSTSTCFLLPHHLPRAGSPVLNAHPQGWTLFNFLMPWRRPCLMHCVEWCRVFLRSRG